MKELLDLDLDALRIEVETEFELWHGLPFQRKWVLLMKITIDIATDLAVRAQALAAKRGVTLRTVVEQGLRMALEEDQGAKRYRLPNRSVQGRGLHREFGSRPWSDILEASYGGRES